jgi:hypothetical protein
VGHSFALQALPFRGNPQNIVILSEVEGPAFLFPATLSAAHILHKYLSFRSEAEESAFAFLSPPEIVNFSDAHSLSFYTKRYPKISSSNHQKPSYSSPMKNFLPCILWALLCSCACGQATPAATNWQQLQQIPLHTRVHVSADKMSRTCSIDSVTDENLTCSGSVTNGHYTFPRAEVKSVKVTRYGISAVGGTAIGAGAGFLFGVAAAHGSQGSFTIVSNQAVWGIFTAIGAVVGALIAGPLDLFRGPTVYRR